MTWDAEQSAMISGTYYCFVFFLAALLFNFTSGSAGVLVNVSRVEVETPMEASSKGVE